jgi:hypothetical protein
MQPPLEALGDAAGRLVPAVSRALGPQGAELAAALTTLDGLDFSRLINASAALNRTVLPAIRDSIQPVGALCCACELGGLCCAFAGHAMQSLATSQVFNAGRWSGYALLARSHTFERCLVRLLQAFEDLYDWQPPTMSIQVSMLRCAR